MGPNRVSVTSTEVEENEGIDEKELVVHGLEVAAVEEVAYEEDCNHAEINESQNLLHEEVEEEEEEEEEKVDIKYHEKAKKGKGKVKVKEKDKCNKNNVIATQNVKKTKKKRENSEEKEERGEEDKSCGN